MFLLLVCHQKTEPPKCLQPRAASCWTGSSALVSAEAPQHCHLQRVMGRRRWSALHCHGLLWRRWSVPEAQGAKRATSAWKSGGRMVCTDCHGFAGTCYTHNIPLAPRWQEDDEYFKKKISLMLTWMKHFLENVYIKWTLSLLTVTLECFWVSDIYIIVDRDSMSNCRGQGANSLFI